MANALKGWQAAAESIRWRQPWETLYEPGREPVVGVLLALSARLEAQDAQLAKLAERVGELEQRLKRDSRNSSLPPSQDPPWAARRGQERGSGRKRGGQPGHVGHGRSLFPEGFQNAGSARMRQPEGCQDEPEPLARLPVDE